MIDYSQYVGKEVIMAEHGTGEYKKGILIEYNPDKTRQFLVEIDKTKWFTHHCYPIGELTKDGSDKINHPSHYTGGAKCECGRPIECIDVVENMSFCRGNAIKYLWRAGKKENEIEDLKKSLWYIQREIELLTKQQTASTTGEETGKEATAAEGSAVGDLIADTSF